MKNICVITCFLLIFGFFIAQDHRDRAAIRSIITPSNYGPGIKLISIKREMYDDWKRNFTERVYKVTIVDEIGHEMRGYHRF